MSRGRSKYRLGAILLLLVVLHFGLRPFLGDPRPAPDFLLLALLIYAIRSSPGPASLAGFLVGVLGDALKPDAFGSGALAHTVVGFVAAWGKAVFFAENLLVSGGFFFAGNWIRDLLVLLAGGSHRGSAFLWQIGFWSPLQALTTAIVGVGVLILFQRWLDVRTVE
ncbi:MAG: rod shape-determining protein MreD [Gemmatimonadetes bacterium]|nr:rod shape-determining protein MreD [Gemmatimonadota bacterium]